MVMERFDIKVRAFLGKRVNSDLIDMRAKERTFLVLHFLLVFTGRNHLTRRSLI